MKDKVCIVTGASNGIGYQTALKLASCDAHVILACRSKERGEKATREIKAQTENPKVECMILDLASMKSIRAFAAEFLKTKLPLHVLVNNAGILPIDTTRRTEDGYEMTFGVNYLGHFLCTNLLLEALKQGAPSRVISVASLTHSEAFPDIDYITTLKEKCNGREGQGDSISMSKNRKFLYSHSKLCNVMFAYELNRRYSKHGIYANALCPGVVASNILNDANWFIRVFGKYVMQMIGRTPEQGAATPFYVASSSDLEKVGGNYYTATSRKMKGGGNREMLVTSSKSSPISYDPLLSSYLWQVSSELVQLPHASSAPFDPIGYDAAKRRLAEYLGGGNTGSQQQRAFPIFVRLSYFFLFALIVFCIYFFS